MALEAWAHRQIENGRPFKEVLNDVLGPDGSSVAFLAVAVDLVLSHWSVARDVAWPFLATPELVQFDDARYNRRVGGVDRSWPSETEPANWRVRRADLDERASRRARLSDQMGYFVFQASAESLADLRAALALARDRVATLPDDHDPISGLRATAERLLRMTDAAHGSFTTVRMADGSEIEARQFRPSPAEQASVDVLRQRSDTNHQQLNARLTIQSALFDSEKSTAEIVAEGVRWAQAQAVDLESDDDDEDNRNFDREWTRRTKVMAAALAARDYEGLDRSEILKWAGAMLHRSAVEADRKYRGNNQIQYSAKAIAAVGLMALYSKSRDTSARDALLGLAAHNHGAVLNAIAQGFRRLHQTDPQLVRSFIRVVMTTSIYTRYDYDEEVEKRNNEAQRARVEAAIAAEKAWLNGAKGEPPWPELPPWLTRSRRYLRLGLRGDELDDHEESASNNLHTDERVLGELASHLIFLTIDGAPDWLVALSAHFMQWTSAANGPQGMKDRERDNGPTKWNVHFFEYAGFLAVALSQHQVSELFLEPMCRLNDEPFHDAAASFLRGFDRATLATDTNTPESPEAVRIRIAARMRLSWGYKRAASEKATTVESHFGDLIYAMFYHGSQWGRPTRPSLPDRWVGLPITTPTISELTKDAASSGFLATIFLNLVESYPSAALLPHVADTFSAWCSAYGSDVHFWLELGIGGRVCGWLDKVLSTEEVSLGALGTIRSDLLKSLDVLIRSGVAQATEIEAKIAGLCDCC